WADARGAQFDPTRPYRVRLPGGGWFNVFFYDGPIARAVAFGEALSSGDDLVRRLEAGFSDGRGHDEALTVAVDGETFGHHRKGAQLLRDPWAARDQFIEVVLQPERRNAAAFVARHAQRELDAAARVKALRLLEMQRQAMLMYTSCGWFFSEVSGLETVQILKYAARALQLAREGCGSDLEAPFKAALERAPSNIPARTDARRVYEQEVQPSIASLDTVAAHYAIAGLVEDFPRRARIFCHEVQTSFRRREDVGTAALSVARIEVRSLITQEQIDLTTCVLHFSGA